jgi:Fic family protein
MSRRALVLEAHHTTHIEGTRLTLAQAERLMNGQEVPEADADDVQELLNYRAAFDLVSQYLGEQAPVTEGLIREIHRRLVAGVRGGAAAPGEYRRVQNYVVNSATHEVLYTPPPAYEVPILMAELVEWINRERGVHPVLVSGISQYQLVHIHPFLDGNGRTSRLLSAVCLYREGYDFRRLFTISEYYDRDRQAFYQALQSVRENGMDMTGWLEYFVQGLAAQLFEVKKLGERAIRRDVMVGEHQLSDRQAKALEYVLEHGSLTANDLRLLCPDTTLRSLQRDLRQMVQAGILYKEGATNRLVYRLRTEL